MTRRPDIARGSEASNKKGTKQATCMDHSCIRAKTQRAYTMSLSPPGPAPRHTTVCPRVRWGSTSAEPFALDEGGARCRWVEKPLLATVRGPGGVLAVVYVAGPMLPTISGTVTSIEWMEATRGCGYSVPARLSKPSAEVWGWAKGVMVAAFCVHRITATLHCAQCGEECDGIDGVQAHLKTSFRSPPMLIINHQLVRAKFKPVPLTPARIPPPVAAAALHSRLCHVEAEAATRGPSPLVD